MVDSYSAARFAPTSHGTHTINKLLNQGGEKGLTIRRHLSVVLSSLRDKPTICIDFSPVVVLSKQSIWGNNRLIVSKELPTDTL